MNQAKEAARSRDKLTHFLTYADNNAVGYFEKQVNCFAGCMHASLAGPGFGYDPRRAQGRWHAAGIGIDKFAASRRCNVVVCL